MAVLLCKHCLLPPARTIPNTVHTASTASIIASDSAAWQEAGIAPEVQPPPGPVLDEGADLDVDEGQHAQRGDDLKEDCGDAVRRPYQLRQGQTVVLVLRTR